MSESRRGHSSSATPASSMPAVAALGRMLGNLTWNTDDPKSDYDLFQDRFDGIVMTFEGGLELTNQCDEKLGRRRQPNRHGGVLCEFIASTSFVYGSDAR